MDFYPLKERYPTGKLVDPSKIKCNYLDCAWGMGLAGKERCFHGTPTNTDCEGFIKEEDLE